MISGSSGCSVQKTHMVSIVEVVTLAQFFLNTG